MPVVIGLCGYAGSGKDEAAKGLVDRGWQRVSFADGVRELAAKINPVYNGTDGIGYRLLSDDLNYRGWEYAKKNPEVRRLLQNIGTGAREVMWPDIWLDVARRKFLGAFDAEQSVVITDVRFRNEVDAVRECFDRHSFGPPHGRIVRITRPGIGPVNGHISETAIDDIEPDFTIVNDGTPEELQAKLVEYAESLAEAGCKP